MQIHKEVFLRKVAKRQPNNDDYISSLVDVTNAILVHYNNLALSVQRRKVWLTATTRVLCSNAARTRNPLKSAGVAQTRQQISAVSRPKFTILSAHVEKVLQCNNFFPIVDSFLISEDVARQSCAMVPTWRFFAFCISASRMQHISDMHSKFALSPHNVWKYARQPISDR